MAALAIAITTVAIQAMIKLRIATSFDHLTHYSQTQLMFGRSMESNNLRRTPHSSGSPLTAARPQELPNGNQVIISTALPYARADNHQWFALLGARARHRGRIHPR